MRNTSWFDSLESLFEGTGDQRGWFPSGFAILGWVLFAAWIVFAFVVVAANTGIWWPRILEFPFYVSSVAVLGCGPLWLMFAVVFAFKGGLESGTMSERVELLLLLTLSLGYVAILLWLG